MRSDGVRVVWHRQEKYFNVQYKEGDLNADLIRAVFPRDPKKVLCFHLHVHSICMLPIPSVSWDITVSHFSIGMCSMACVEKPFSFTLGLNLVLPPLLLYYIHFFLPSLQFPLFIFIGKLSQRKIPDVHIEFC